MYSRLRIFDPAPTNGGNTLAFHRELPLDLTFQAGWGSRVSARTVFSHDRVAIDRNAKADCLAHSNIEISSSQTRRRGRMLATCCPTASGGLCRGSASSRERRPERFDKLGQCDWST